jgi:hypothetical protein
MFFRSIFDLLNSYNTNNHFSLFSFIFHCHNNNDIESIVYRAVSYLIIVASIEEQAKMASSSEEAPDTATRQSFSLLQSRKFIVPSSKSGDTDTDADDNYDNRKSTLCRLAKLCPSMDLILVKIFSSSSSSLVIYRSLSWQKVAGIPLREYSNVGDGAGNSSDSDSGSLSYCWSPSGQCVAVAQDSSVSLYGVENLITAAGRNGTMSGSNSGSADWTITIVDSNSENVVGGSSSSSSSSKSVDVIALHWAHVGKLHPTAASPSMEEEEREISWR